MSRRKAKYAIAIDQRTGFKHRQRDMLFEPGTRYYVHKKESDGKRNLVEDPLNYPSPKLGRPEKVALRHPSPDTSLLPEAISVSSGALGLPLHAVVSSAEGQFVDHLTSVT
jgi:hypothetical protein